MIKVYLDPSNLNWISQIYRKLCDEIRSIGKENQLRTRLAYTSLIQIRSTVKSETFSNLYDLKKI